VVAVDSRSRDDSADLLVEAFDEVVTPFSRTSYPEAVQLGLAQDAAGEAEWIWLLHDDSTPAPDALETLLVAARESPEADILGPKLREWPSLKRLLEVGVTISGTGRRETGLERGEYDQGQHDDVREVLAVNTAGMLVRRSVLRQLGGFDKRLPIFGNDIDFGWRAAKAGFTTIVVPTAIVFHAEAAHRGVRRTSLTGRHTHYQERRAAIFTLLANGSSRGLPWHVVRLFFGTLLRMAGFLVLRSAGEALDELAALFSVYFGHGEIRQARRERREAAGEGDHEAREARVRSLLPPGWLPYRHGLDLVGDIVSAAFNQAQDVADRRRTAAEAAAPAPIRRPVVVRDDDEAPAEDTGLVARFLTNPLALSLTLFVLLAVVGARTAFGSVSGGGLSPASHGAADLWRLHLESWHPLGQGTAVPAPPYVAPVAALASLLGGSVQAAISALLVLAVPVALLGAWRFLGVAGRLVDPGGSPRWLVAIGAATYALVPVVSGAWGQGRLGTVVTAALLPWLARAALGFADPETDRRWRAAWRTALLLTLVAACTPTAWLFAVVLALVLVVAALAIPGVALGGPSVWGPPAVTVGAVPLLLAPWWLPALVQQAGGLLLLDAGRQPQPSWSFLGLLTGRFDGGVGAPWWLGLLSVIFAVAALVPRATRIPVLLVWIVVAVAGVTAGVLSLVTVHVAVETAQPGLSFFLVLLRACFVLAGLLGIQGLITLLRRSNWGTQRGLLLSLATVAAVVPAVGLGWFVLQGPGDLTDTRASNIPEYMVQTSILSPANGILVIRGDVAHGLSYTVRRGDGVTLGEDEILAGITPDPAFDRGVVGLVSRPTPGVVAGLADAGIRYVVLPAPADGDVAAGLDGTAGLVQASAEDRTTRAWQVGKAVDPQAVDGPRSWLHVALLVLQGLALLVVLVLCLPTWRHER
ncbi:MAG: glycosyltransferase, partial [Nocardioides sp.]